LPFYIKNDDKLTYTVNFGADLENNEAIFDLDLYKDTAPTTSILASSINWFKITSNTNAAIQFEI